MVIVGGGFGGLYAAQGLGRPVAVTPGRPAQFPFVSTACCIRWPPARSRRARSPRRYGRVAHKKTCEVLLGEAVDLDAATAEADSGRWRRVPYDSLIVAYRRAQLLFRSRRLGAGCAGAEIHRGRHGDPPQNPVRLRGRRARNRSEMRREWLTFVIVGGDRRAWNWRGRWREIAKRYLAPRFPFHSSRGVAHSAARRFADTCCGSCFPKRFGRRRRSLARAGSASRGSTFAWPRSTITE